MKLYYTWFQDPERPDFNRMRKVFEYSLRKHNPDIEIIEHKEEYPEGFKNLRPAHFENIYKLSIWNSIVQNAKLEDGAFFLTDCDMMCVNNLDEIYKDIGNKDIYFTTRSPDITDVRCNVGVVYINPTERAKEFFNRWMKLSNEFQLDELVEIDWNKLIHRYKGAIQTTLGYMWDRGEFQDIIGELPCIKWNATVFEWRLVNMNEARFIHIKSNLRTYILQNYNYINMEMNERDSLFPLQQMWFKFEKELKEGKL